jgi:hypothetical protein
VDKHTWIDAVLRTLATQSRTLGGISDTSSSADKPKLAAEGEALAQKTRQNLRNALEFLWENRGIVFHSADEVRGFIDRVAAMVSEGLLAPGQSLYRTWDTKFENQAAAEEIEPQYRQFCLWLFGSLDNDPVETAALTEKRLDGDIHPLADGCGRTTKILSAFILLRHELFPPRYRSRGEYYEKITTGDTEWITFWRSMYEGD